MTRRTYGQLCSLALSLDVVGERWSLLIVRDLMLAPRRFSDLLKGLPGIGTTLLSRRLRELEDAGIATRRAAPRPEGGVRYELTARGRDLFRAMVPLAVWGVPLLRTKRAEADAASDGGLVFRPELMSLMFIASFRPEEARGVHDCYEFRISGDAVWATVDDGELDVGAGSPPRPPDFIATMEFDTLAAYVAGELSPAEYAANVEVDGDVEATMRAARIFVPPSPGAQPLLQSSR